MKFYTIRNGFGETIGCELTKKAAIEFAAERGFSKKEIEIEVIDCNVNAETIRRLLGNLGGFSE
jgi:hypothetical protein